MPKTLKNDLKYVLIDTKKAQKYYYLIYGYRITTTIITQMRLVKI
jgi:hypothetical protein